jgi:NADPH-dependent ferric siderophore reductase
MTDAWRLFDVKVGAVRRLSPSFLRITFTGEELKFFADNGYDQRIKLVFDGVRRTYTVRAVRQDLSEVDVDVVSHPGGDGPAVRWLRQVSVGDPLLLIGPDSRFDGVHGGIDFRVPGRTVLLAGDETAVPAIASVLECLPAEAEGEAILEVPTAQDFLELKHPAGVRVVWTAREGMPHGSGLVPAVQASRVLTASATKVEVDDVDVDEEILWDVPEGDVKPQCYVWIAGEAAVVRTLRQFVLGELGMDRKMVALMGYWRLGKAESA